MHSPERRNSLPVVVLSREWGRAHNETAFVDRSLAGALSRRRPVDVLVPGIPGPPFPDGHFDPVPIGNAGPSVRRWAAPQHARWPQRPHAAVLLHADDTDAWALAALHASTVPIVAVVHAAASANEAAPRAGGATVSSTATPLAVGPVVPAGATLAWVGVHVPVNPLAARRRHSGLGFTNYVLVLSDRPATPATSPPTSPVAWLSAARPRDDVVVVEGGTAAVWRARSLRGTVAVDTRTDLWRLMAHARATVDLHPSPVARECIESLRFGTPIVVPARTPAAVLATAGGGLWYEDMAELIGCLDELADPVVRDALGAQGRADVDARFGDPAAFVERVGIVLDHALGG